MHTCTRTDTHTHTTLTPTTTRVQDNTLYDNGKVSRDPPASRQKYAGLTIHTSLNVSVVNNDVDAPFADVRNRRAPPSPQPPPPLRPFRLSAPL